VTVGGDVLRRRETLADVSRLDAARDANRRNDEGEP